jgi:hypothetical protein
MFADLMLLLAALAFTTVIMLLPLRARHPALRRVELKLDTCQKNTKAGSPIVDRRQVRLERHGSMRTPGLSRPCGSSAFFAARSASANSGGRCRSYHGR